MQYKPRAPALVRQDWLFFTTESLASRGTRQFTVSKSVDGFPVTVSPVCQ